jgi:hypothetical protein
MRNLSIRVLSRVTRRSSAALFGLGDSIDRVLRLVPGLSRLSETGLIQAVKPA